MQILKKSLATLTLLLSACGGGGSSSELTTSTPLATMKLFIANGGVVNGTSVNAQTNTVSVQAGTSLAGTVNLTSINTRSAGDVVPVIYQPSWGNRASSFVTVSNWVGTGSQSLTASLSLTAPSTPGTYMIYFASGAELTSAQVASSSNWQWNGGQPVWNDGNDIVDQSMPRIANSLSDGYLVIPNYSTPMGSAPVAIGMTFIQVSVTP